MTAAKRLAKLRVPPGRPADLAKLDPSDRLGFDDKALVQNRLWAEARRSLLLVLQGLDASGKDGTTRHVFTGVNPQGCRVHSFKAPAGDELTHDYLWRIHAECPAHGEIGVFNRSSLGSQQSVRCWRQR